MRRLSNPVCAIGQSRKQTNNFKVRAYNPMKVAFSLNTKSKPAAPPPSLKRPAVFASGDDDQPIDAAPTSSTADKNVAANKKLLAQNVGSSKTARKRMEAEMMVDSTVYEYDEVWDKMQEAKQRQKEAKDASSKERKACSHRSVYFTLLTYVTADTYQRLSCLCSYAEARLSTCRGKDDAAGARS